MILKLVFIQGQTLGIFTSLVLLVLGQKWQKLAIFGLALFSVIFHFFHRGPRILQNQDLKKPVSVFFALEQECAMVYEPFLW